MKKTTKPKPKDRTVYKVWLCIESYNEKTGQSDELDAPGASLAVFKSYQKAWKYAEEVSARAEDILHP